jgi:hypothetical protein
MFESSTLTEFFAVARGADVELFRVTVNVPDPFVMDLSGSVNGGGATSSADAAAPIVEPLGVFTLRAIALSDDRPVKLLPEDEEAILLKANPNVPPGQKATTEVTTLAAAAPTELPQPYDSPVYTSALSLFVRGNELIVTSVGSIDESEDRRLLNPVPSADCPVLHMFTGALEISSLSVVRPNSTLRRHEEPGAVPTPVPVLRMQRLLNMGTTVSSCVFRDSHCAFVVPSGVCVVDILAGDLASLIDEQGYDDGCGAVPYAALTASSSTAATCPSAWNGSIVAFANSSNSRSNSYVETVFAYRHHRAALLKAQFDC